jgi:hypothetical protein
VTQVTQARSGDRVIARDRVIGKEQIAVIARNRSEISLGRKSGHQDTGSSENPTPLKHIRAEEKARAKSQELKANGQQLAADSLLQ